MQGKTSEVSSGHAGFNATLYIKSAFVFLAKQVLCYYTGMFPPYAVALVEKPGAAAAVGFSWQGLPEF